ncbi:hypothetical protein PFLmoz3_03897 [Pseudomonas fluorescens]|uniref:Uncharacterized protein n=1 Tax=Pseudomonas fluorescens TaxID=294 RepID=A0A109LFD5_PSEFL|nr:hypothetical protein PFLmoz3_03897 [Pseudomonas fluorescens]
MSSGSSKPVSRRPSPRPGRTQSAKAASALISRIICAWLAHRDGRRFGSNDTLRPALRIWVISSNDSARVASDSAGGMPVACRWRACSSVGWMASMDKWLAAEPLRKYST